ncbi:MAG: NirD/YgiW/YdeI family stress tolerance protein [Saprospiraceae bacterium]|nr:NirD/YgiW/YdeI family stress tolerance protein [Saprospiraceae bacterium]
MKIIPSLLIFCLTAFFYALPAHAQFQGPTALDKEYTVKEVRAKAAHLDRLDIAVRVRGNIVRQQDEDTYLFEDGTGMIRVDIDSDKLPDRPFNDKTVVILIGEVEYNLFGKTEINVDRVVLVD